MIKNFPFKLLGVMTLLFVVMSLGMHFVFDLILDVTNQKISDASYVWVSILFSVFCFSLVSLYAVLPLNGAIKYLKLLLNQPKTENIRVSEEAHLQNFKYAEWGELGDLVQKVERKLRRRTKALLRETTELTALMNSLNAPIVAVTAQMDVGFLNSAFAVLFDLEDDHLVQNKNIKKIDELISNSEVIDVLKSAIQDSNFEKKMVTFKKGDRVRIFSISMSPLRRGLDNSIYGVVASFNDETVKVELDQKRMDFVANASHELRTPIAAVSTSVSLLKRVDDEETKKQVMESLSLNSERLVSLAQDLLDLSKLEDEGEVIEAEMCDLETLTNEAIKGLIHPKKDLVETECLVETGYLDESKAKQVVTNLVRNALIYTPEGTRVQISWFMADQNLCLKVQDWGQGVPESEHERIFERFFRVDRSRSRKSGGSGIGLSIVKHIMELHGGEVRLEPYKEGEGATFVCSFPQ